MKYNDKKIAKIRGLITALAKEIELDNELTSSAYNFFKKDGRFCFEYYVNPKKKLCMVASDEEALKIGVRRLMEKLKYFEKEYFEEFIKWQLDEDETSLDTIISQAVKNKAKR